MADKILTPADMKAAEAVCLAVNGRCARIDYVDGQRCKGHRETVAAVLDAYGLTRAKANGLAEGRMRTKRAGKKEQNRE